MLVDDHAIVRRGLRAILELEPDISVIAEAGGRSEALRLLDRVEPDVILLDLKLSADHDAEGLELCSAILCRRPGSRVVILSTFLDENLLHQSLRRGAKAYVLKDVDVVELVRIIRAVSRGQSGFDSRSAEMMRALVAHDTDGTDGEDGAESELTDGTDGEDGAESELTAREREVVALLAHGLTNREIGTRMFVSESTAKFHVHNVMRKLGVRRRAEVAYAAGQLGLPLVGPRN